MSFNIKGQKCVVCSAYLFDEDDIVYCPECGAPHHRDCYNTVGHCALSDSHGTEQQYKAPDKLEEPSQNTEQPNPLFMENKNNFCRSCGAPLKDNSSTCSNCGLPINEIPSSIPFGSFAQVIHINDNVPVAENVTAKEAAEIVRVNTIRYIPKFINMRDKKTSWNWAAFILPNAWFAYRKMYKESIFSSVFMIISIILSIPFNLSLLQLPLTEETVNTYFQLAEYYMEIFKTIDFVPLALAFVGLIIGLIVRFVCGIFGDAIYKNYVVSSAEKIRNSEDREQTLHKYSGTSFIAFAIAVFALEFIPAIISSFFV